VKTDVEELSPTRVKLTVEVPFDELKSNLDKAYREISKQVRLKGFRPGKVPARLIDQYVGRGAVLQEAVNDALPELYGRAVEETEVFALGQPDVEITKLDDGDELAFTAEVDIRPKFEVPAYDGMPVTVPDTVVTPDEVEETLANLRERFASLTAAGRPAETGDFASIDMSAVIDGEDVEEARTSGYSYEIGSGGSVEGLDEALTGMSADETKTFTAKLAGGEHAGKEAEITVTVQSVKAKELPDLDDEFAQLASEFDTIGELRADTRKRLERQKRLQQLAQARDNALEALLEKVDFPLPDSVVENEVSRRNQQLDQQLQQVGLSREDYLKSEDKTTEEFDVEVLDAAREAVKGGFLLDQLALQEELKVENEELSEYVVTQAMQMGVQPQQLAEHLAESNQLPALVSEVLRTKSLNLILEHVKVTEESGAELDLEAIRRELSGGPGESDIEVINPEDAEDAEDAESAEAASDDDTAAAAEDAADAAEDVADAEEPAGGSKGKPGA
jgi:trigger factor